MSAKQRYTTTPNFVAPLAEPVPTVERGYPPARTVESVLANGLEHLITGIGAIFALCGVWLAGWMINQRWQGLVTDIAMTGGVILGCGMLVAGSIAVWHHTEDEWLLRHDRHEWEEKAVQLRTLTAWNVQWQTHAETQAAAHAEELALLRTTYEADTEAHVADYSKLAAEHWETARALAAAKTALAHAQGARNSFTYPQKTEWQRAGEGIITEIQRGGSTSRDSICKNYSVSQSAWREAMRVLKDANLARLEENGKKWRITSTNPVTLRSALSLMGGESTPPTTPPPLVDETV